MNVDDERYTNEFTIQPYYSFNTRSRQTINPFLPYYVVSFVSVSVYMHIPC